MPDADRSLVLSRFTRAGAQSNMEMKKSISETERALRSYGAVSETSWTADKGERHASKSVVVAARGGRKYGVVVSVYQAEPRWVDTGGG